MAEEEALKHDTLPPNTLIAWERIHLPSLPTQFQSQQPIISLQDPHGGDTPWSTPPPPHKDHHTAVVFPPTNHEGLNLHHHVPETHVETVKPSVPVVSSEVKSAPIVRPIAGPIWVKWWFLRFKLTGIVSYVWNRLINFPMVGSTVVVVLCYWIRRRRRRSRGEAVDELLGVIKEKDERIHQLLHQIARMNELLLASHHGVPMISKATST
ncbi:hypothetical protein HanRHA438_Chr05g0240801 [Helianthus annuus]|uniref:Transmembrane protein n=1 Tax=Helianthus annuus TaxID=4232 RepID=A0A251URV4_HELAN|nr:uncharacterized protein LOC110941710 [Helianthus annuus]KAF5807249.1 hypothetical protein HanXRQr2_Chr05g0231521 [Helianthus annuus]KAJ0585761.1 hypothetical protein HanHA89_Chr05g0204381 [Helianthus annuus]KAJ0920390.1 hypothetical protein HanRHA438_Chr05g0240801 [Helianthus annuus]